MAIVGAGRLGALLATRMPGAYRKVIISPRKEEAVRLADEVGGIASDQMSAARGAAVIFLTAGGLEQTVQNLVPHAEGALLVNMVPESMTGPLADKFPGLRFAAAKIVGHPREMELGSPGVVALDHIADGDEELLRPLLSGLGPIARHDEERVRQACETVEEVMSQAESTLRIRLAELGLDEPSVKAAITSAGPGVLRDLSHAAGQAPAL